MIVTILTHVNRYLICKEVFLNSTLRCFYRPIFSQNCSYSSFSKTNYFQKQEPRLHLTASCDFESFVNKCYHSSRPKPNDVKGWLNKTTERAYGWMDVVSPTARQFAENLAKGAKANWLDVKTYWFVRKRLKVNPSATVNYSEEMKIFLLKREAVKIFPLIPFFMVPFGFITLFVPIYFFPRYVLPHTYWTDMQRKKFHSQMHQERLPHYNIILNHMNYHRENSSDSSFTHVLDDIFTIINANNIPSNTLMLQFRSLCNDTSSPFNLEVLKIGVLLRSFSRISMAYPFPLPASFLCNQLETYGKTIIRLDKKMRHENTLQKLSAKDIEIAALLRGANSANLTVEANIYWLRNWLELTKSCNSNDYWFVLHAMVLLSYNYNQLKFQRGVFG